MFCEDSIKYSIISITVSVKSGQFHFGPAVQLRLILRPNSARCDVLLGRRLQYDTQQLSKTGNIV